MTVYQEIIGHLNERTGKRFNPRSKATQKLINGRISEGHTPSDFIAVIDIKCSHWLGDPKMSEYLRPDTLFRPVNFDKYLNQSPAAEPERDRSIAARDKEAAFQQHVMDGGDPDAFDWSD